MNSLFWYTLAAVGEIGGCFTFWMWLRLHKSPLWVLPGLVALAFFASALTRVDSDDAGRTFAAYGGIYIISSLLWLWGVENVKPNHWDLIGAIFSLAGTAIILFGAARTR
jgi:small multidrug resistance family-3 protein